jgi:hypothetical protein
VALDEPVPVVEVERVREHGVRERRAGRAQAAPVERGGRLVAGVLRRGVVRGDPRGRRDAPGERARDEVTQQVVDARADVRGDVRPCGVREADGIVVVEPDALLAGAPGSTSCRTRA